MVVVVVAGESGENVWKTGGESADNGACWPRQLSLKEGQLANFRREPSAANVDFHGCSSDGERGGKVRERDSLFERR